MKPTKAQRPWRRPLLGVLVFLAIAAATFGSVFLGSWTSVQEVVPAEIDKFFVEALREAGGGTPYIEIEQSGTAVVHHEQETVGAELFETLTLLAWAPGDEKVLRVDYPRWFVRLKTSTFVNLGTIVAAARKDWNHLDLSISYGDLLKRGPGLLLDHRSQSGARIVLWTTAKGDQPADSSR
jgi:hypothetical protein